MHEDYRVFGLGFTAWGQPPDPGRTARHVFWETPVGGGVEFRGCGLVSGDPHLKNDNCLGGL